MDTKSIRLVQDSFQKVVPIADTAATLFYKRLFEIAPEVKPLFSGDMAKQGAMLMGALAMAVKGLDKPDTILPALRTLGAKHVDYGVKTEHYALVGRALIDTLELGLGPDFVPEVRAAWIEAYTLLSGVMIAASKVKP